MARSASSRPAETGSNTDNEGEEEDEAVPEGPVDNAWAKKVPKFSKGDMKHSLLEESSYATLFPKYREKYIRECWPVLEKVLEEQGIACELDLIQGRMTVKTTKSTWDPYSIIKARDVIILLSRSVPVEQAVKVFEEGITHEIIKIRSMVRNKERFVKRRQRLVGSNGTTHKALELLTKCYIMIQGGTVACIGPYKGVYQVVKVVKQTMQNVHPVYLLKALMIEKMLREDPKMKNEDWSRFMPSFKSKNVPRKKPKIRKQKKPYTPFPPPQMESKVDKLLAEGKYFMDPEQSKSHKRKLAEVRHKEAAKSRQAKRAEAFIPPKENPHTSRVASANSDVDLNSLKKKLKKVRKV